MTNEQITYLIAGVSGTAALAAFVVFVMVPAWASYTRAWERVAAALLSVYVLLAFIGVGAAGGLAIVWFWDRISPS